MSLNILIADDEKISRLYIRNLISEFLPGASIYEADSAARAKEILLENIVGILFLDINMPKMNGIELMKSFDKKGFELVYITAYEKYAIDAIKQDAVDYILKPINKREFRNMLQRVIRIHEEKKTHIKKATATDLSEEAYAKQKIAVYHENGIKFIPISEIEYLKALNTYTLIHHISGAKTIVSKAINRFENNLDPRWFFRIHKSYIINIRAVRAYSPTENNMVITTNGAEIPVSRRRLKTFLEIMKNNKDIITP